MGLQHCECKIIVIELHCWSPHSGAYEAIRISSLPPPPWFKCVSAIVVHSAQLF